MGKETLPLPPPLKASGAWGLVCEVEQRTNIGSEGTSGTTSSLYKEPKAQKEPKEHKNPAPEAEGEQAKKPRRRPNHRRHKPKPRGDGQ